MKNLFKTIVFIALAVAMLSAASCGKTSREPQPEGITKSDVDSVSYMMGYSFGMQLKEGNFGGLDMSWVLKGMRDAANDTIVDVKEFRRVVNGFLDKRHNAIAEEMKQKSADYLDVKRHEEGVDSTMSGLLYKIIQSGGDVHPSVLDTVEVNYEGKNLAGKVFDSSYERGSSATFPLNAVIPGWSEGIRLIGEGGEIELYIPSNLAYGERGGGPDIAGNEAITFKVELIKIKPYQPRQ